MKFLWIVFLPFCINVFADIKFDHIPISAVESFWNKMPCNIEHSKLPISKEFFDEVERVRYQGEPHIPLFAEFTKWHGKKVLEIGCGIGTEAINFARAGAYYTAIELSNKSLDLTRTRFKIHGLSARLVHGDAEELEKYFSGEKFDLIWSHGVIHHLP